MAFKKIFTHLTLYCQILSSFAIEECKPWSNVEPDDLSVIYSEQSGGLASQLLNYAMLRQLRQNPHYLNAYMSRHCYETLAKVFTERSIQDVHVFEDWFCKAPQELPYEAYIGPMKELLTKTEFHRGRFLWLFPSNEVLKLHEDHEREYKEYK